MSEQQGDMMDYFALMKEKPEFKVTARIIAEDEKVTAEEAEKRASFVYNSTFCFYFLKDQHKELQNDSALVELIGEAIRICDSPEESNDTKMDPHRVVKGLEIKVKEMAEKDINPYALSGVYQFMAEQLNSYSQERIDQLLFLTEAFKLWPENDHIYDQLAHFCSTTMSKGHYVGEECEELEMAKTIKMTLLKKRPGRAIKETFDTLIGAAEMLNEIEAPPIDDDDTEEPDEEENEGSSGRVLN